MDRQETCDLCKGLGWLTTGAAPGDPDFGRAVPCECKSAEIGQRIMARLNRLDGLMEDERQYQFGAERTQAQTAAAQHIHMLITEGWGMATLTGPFGTGKTRLLMAAVNASKLAGRPAHYTTMRDLLTYLRKAFNPSRDPADDLSFDQRWDLLSTAPVLAIDELDKANATPWALEQFSALIDLRWRMMRTHVTLFAMNSDMASLPGDVADRLEDIRASIFDLSGPSLRQF